MDTDVVSTKVSNLHPWRRFFARWLDLFLFGFLLGAIAALGDKNGSLHKLMAHENPAVSSVTVCFLWVFVETIFIASWGRTPGKFLYGIKLTSESGENLNFKAAIKRSFDVWIRGICIGLPLFSLFTAGYSHKKLMREGMTSWDKKGQYVVKHSDLTRLRKIIALSVVAISTLLFFSGQL